MKRIKKFLYIAILSTVLTIAFGIGNDAFASVVKQNIKIKDISGTSTGIQLRWTNSYSAQGYIIYRSINGGTYKKYDKVISKKYIDEDVETGQSYSYKIQSYKYVNKKNKYSKMSKGSQEYVALPYGVTNVSVVKFESYNMITWNINELASGYEVYRSSDNIVWESVGNVDTNTGSYIDDNIDPTVEKYNYRISAYEIVDGKKYSSIQCSESTDKKIKGIDVSYHKGAINWKKVRQQGITFAMIRLGYGTKKGGILDSKFDYNLTQAKKNGIKVGVYLYSYADNVKEAKNEAKFTVKILKKYGTLDYPVAFDFENSYRNRAKYKSSNTKIIKTFCDYVESKGYDTSVYSFQDFFKNAVNYKKVSKYGIWLARWTNNSNSFNAGGIPNVQMWQYSDRGKVKGIGGRVDLNLEIIN